MIFKGLVVLFSSLLLDRILRGKEKRKNQDYGRLHIGVIKADNPELETKTDSSIVGYVPHWHIGRPHTIWETYPQEINGTCEHLARVNAEGILEYVE